ncbi:MAG TPA: hypothetical protein VKA21_02985 [Candidatus Binatia bacterium]|nr:hypothetical protein [Candidatus Binatia bacterium]
MKATSWVALVGLVGVGVVVVWSSFRIAGARCEVCVEFAGQHACRTVEGADEHEALAAARTNACATLTSGVTNMLACERAETLRSRCDQQ